MSTFVYSDMKHLVQNNLKTSSTPDAVQSTTREQTSVATVHDGAFLTKVKVDPGPSSPSPRGVETWGPCSPFNLPEPTGQMQFLPPDELSKIMHPPDINNIYSTHSPKEGFALPKSGYMDAEEYARMAANLQASVPHRQVHETEMESSTTRESFVKLEHVNTSLVQSKTDFCEAFPALPAETLLFPEHKLTQIPETLLQTPDVQTDIQDELNCMRIMSETQGHEHELPFSIDFQNPAEMTLTSSMSGPASVHVACEAKTAKKTQIDAPMCHSQLEETGNQKVEKKEYAEETPSGDGALDSKGREGVNICADELKRIRRVKNRASVEKCRTKQRLRMEALQLEMATLQSENKALRDLTSWMDSSVDAISSQVTTFSSAQNIDSKTMDKNTLDGMDSLL